MGTTLIHCAFFLTGPLAVTGFTLYICRGHPATSRLSRRNGGERRTLKDIEQHLFAEARATDSDNSGQIG
jgi:hypothetical protein